MRILVMSDIHANYTALQAVLKDAGKVDETWCLGDLVGYGPDPNAVVEEVHDIPNLTCLLRNHDVAVTGQPRDRDPRAAYAIYDTEACIWTPRRAEYNIPEVQKRIREAGLPEKHAVRIAEGW